GVGGYVVGFGGTAAAMSKPKTTKPKPPAERGMKRAPKDWREKKAQDPGRFETYEHPEVNEHMSFLEMLDVLNQRLIERGEEPIAFDHDCREGICGICSLMISGIAHGPERATTACQLHMRFFNDGDTVTIEPWRAKAFPVVKDLIVDRTAFDRIIQAGGFISAGIGGAPEA